MMNDNRLSGGQPERFPGPEEPGNKLYKLQEMCIKYKKDSLRLAWDKQVKAVIYTKQCSSINILHVDFKNLGKLNKNLRSIPSNLKKMPPRVA